MPKIELYITSVAPTKYGGSFDEVRQQFPKSDNFVVINLVPSEACYKDTPYATIPKSQLPAIVMLERDYRGLQKLRFTVSGKTKKEKEGTPMSYGKKQKELLEKGEFWVALKNEITEILAVSKFYELNGQEFANYSVPIVQMLQYCKVGEIEGAPEQFQNVPKGRLISQEQYNVIMQQFKLKADAF